jgi:hypothetical protein
MSEYIYLSGIDDELDPAELKLADALIKRPAPTPRKPTPTSTTPIAPDPGVGTGGGLKKLLPWALIGGAVWLAMRGPKRNSPKTAKQFRREAARRALVRYRRRRAAKKAYRRRR